MTGHIIIFLIVAIVLLLIGVPVAATLGLSSILFFVLEGIPAMTVVQRLFSGCDVAALMCIPTSHFRPRARLTVPRLRGNPATQRSLPMRQMVTSQLVSLLVRKPTPR